MLFPGSEKGGGGLFPQFSPTFCSMQESQDPTHKAWKARTVNRAHLCMPQSLREGEGLVQVTQLPCPVPKPDKIVGFLLPGLTAPHNVSWSSHPNHFSDLC